MAFDAFTRFPRAFSGRPALARSIYNSFKNAMGPAFNQEFNGTRVQAHLYAKAMGMAHAMRTLKRVKSNAIALSATDLLGNLEFIYGLTPGPNETFRQRRLNLHARMTVGRGSRPEAINSIMTALLGSDFVDWVYATAATLIRFPDTSAEAALEGNFVPPGTPARVVRSAASIFAGSSTVAVTELSDASGGVSAIVGATAAVDPASNTRRENITITDATFDSAGKITSITADFAGVHDAGTLITTQHFPTWRSNAQHHIFQVSADAAVDLERSRLVNRELNRAMKSVSRWDIVSTDDYFGANALVGIHPVGPNSADDPGAWVNDLFGARLVAYWGANPVSFRFDESGNANHLSNEGTEPDKYIIDGTMGGIVLASGHEMSCDSIASIASGTDSPFTVMWWGQWVSGSTPVFQFSHSSGSGVHGWEMEVSKSGPLLGVQRVDDTATEADAGPVLATTDQRFFAHTFVAGSDAGNIIQVDGTVTSSVPLNVNPVTVDQFRVGPAAAEFRVARMIVLNDSASTAELAAVRAQWVAQAAWDA